MRIKVHGLSHWTGLSLLLVDLLLTGPCLRHHYVGDESDDGTRGLVGIEFRKHVARVVASGGVFACHEGEYRRLTDVRVGPLLQQVVVESKTVSIEAECLGESNTSCPRGQCRSR